MQRPSLRRPLLALGALLAACGTTQGGNLDTGLTTLPDGATIAADGALVALDSASPTDGSALDAPRTDGTLPADAQPPPPDAPRTDAQPPPPDAPTPPPDAPPGSCPSAGAGAAGAAVDAINAARVAMGVPCLTRVAALDDSSARHCAYYAANTGMCVANPHVEVAGCAMFYGAQFSDRARASGYAGASFEVMAFSNNPTSAVQQWIDSVWHRTPLLNPWGRDTGYGGAARCDTMDFGASNPSTPRTLVATYPYDGQTNVPTSFAGNEGPQPPAPPGGYPSGYPITLFLQGTITTHELTVAGSTTQLPHVWITPATSGGLLNNGYILYANTPLAARTRYAVHFVGNNGAAVDRTITFTTR